MKPCGRGAGGVLTNKGENDSNEEGEQIASQRFVVLAIAFP